MPKFGEKVDESKATRVKPAGAVIQPTAYFEISTPQELEANGRTRGHVGGSD